MTVRPPRPVVWRGVFVLVIAAAGCRAFNPPRPEEELTRAVGWVDAAEQKEIRSLIRPDELLATANAVRESRRPATLPPKRSILVISGGGAYGAYPAGVLVGWTASGTRPQFDVVTGVSTGALVAALAFLGPDCDAELHRVYTTVTNEDIYTRRRPLRSVLSESFADNSPLARLIADTATDDRIRTVAAEHHKGRRLYVGTTDLEVRRAVVWDMGAIAAQDTPESRDLFRKVLLASAAIPGFFPPVRIPVTVDGVRHVERHVDGGTSSALFFAPPWVSPAERAALPPAWLYGSDVYVLVAGKLYADPEPVRPFSLSIAASAISTVIYDQTRSDLHKIFMLSMLTGMNFHLSSIPKDFPAPASSTSFDPVAMTKLFDEGCRFAAGGTPWRTTPPGYEPGEANRYRAGTALTDIGRRAPVDPNTAGPLNPLSPEGIPVPGPIRK